MMLQVAAPAKVNLALSITGVRADGYHELRSVFLRLRLSDDVWCLRDADLAGPDQLTIEGEVECPVADNLVLRAAAAFRAAAAAEGGQIPSVRIGLHKRIPIAAGLGGGSSDAAAMLQLLAMLHPGIPDQVSIRSLAAAIGADVSFFVDGAGAALVTGIGESVEPLPPPIEPVGLLLVAPPLGATTRDVFRAWDTGPGTVASEAGGTVDELATRLRAGATPSALVELAPRLRDANDLWAAAATVTAGLGELRSSLESRLERPFLLTGSGSTLFALYPSPDGATQDARRIGSDPALAGLHVIATCSTGPRPIAITNRRDP